MTFLQRRRTVSILLILLALAVLPVGAGEERQTLPPEDVDLNKLMSDTMKQHPAADRIGMTWWLPTEYWEVTLAQDPNISASQKRQVISTLDKYVVFGVVRGKLGPFGGGRFQSREEVRDAVVLKDMHGNTHEPLPDDEVDPDAKNGLQMMKPVMANMAGQMGENVYFMVFPARDEEGRSLIDPTADGTFTLKVGQQPYTWRLPLGSLLPEKTCPDCDATCSGAWNFCPWCGTELPQPQQSGGDDAEDG